MNGGVNEREQREQTGNRNDFEWPPQRREWESVKRFVKNFLPDDGPQRQLGAW